MLICCQWCVVLKSCDMKVLFAFCLYCFLQLPGLCYQTMQGFFSTSLFVGLCRRLRTVARDACCHADFQVAIILWSTNCFLTIWCIPLHTSSTRFCWVGALFPIWTVMTFLGFGRGIFSWLCHVQLPFFIISSRYSSISFKTCLVCENASSVQTCQVNKISSRGFGGHVPDLLVSTTGDDTVSFWLSLQLQIFVWYFLLTLYI
jgi:hypothetical protein